MESVTMGGTDWSSGTTERRGPALVAPLPPSPASSPPPGSRGAPHARVPAAACDRDALALAVRQEPAVLPDPRVVALRQGPDEVVGVGQPARLAHLLVAGSGARVAHIVRHRVVEEEHVLVHEGDIAQRALGRVVGSVDAAEGDGPAIRAVQLGDQAERRGLARAVEAHQGDDLPRRAGRRRPCPPPGA